MPGRSGTVRRRDGNHKDIVQALRSMGVAVLDLGSVGDGCPDLLVAYRDVSMLLEVKRPGCGLTKAQAEFIAEWPGRLAVVESREEACGVVAEAARPGEAAGGVRGRE